VYRAMIVGNDPNRQHPRKRRNELLGAADGKHAPGNGTRRGLRGGHAKVRWNRQVGLRTARQGGGATLMKHSAEYVLQAAFRQGLVKVNTLTVLHVSVSTSSIVSLRRDESLFILTQLTIQGALS